MKKREEISEIDAFRNPQKAAQELAKRLGVALAPTAPPAPAVEPVRAPATPSGPFAGPMPAGTRLMMELREELGPDLWPGVLENLAHGRGYVVDLTTNIALGDPPADRYQRGREEKRHGFTIMRVKPRAAA